MLQEKFYIIIETYHKEGRGEEDNVHNLDAEKLNERTVVHIDIANDQVNASDYKKEEDPKTFKNERTGRGPLADDWKVSWTSIITNMLSVMIYQCLSFIMSLILTNCLELR